MATLDNIRKELEKDELDYPELALSLGAKALPHLKTLVAEDDPRIASKAAYLAAVIGDGNAKEVVALAAQSHYAVIRAAAAAAAPLLRANHAVEITATLLGDDETGMRVGAMKAAATLNDPALIERLDRMANEDPEPAIRDLAADMARKSRER
jgi:HEAT repeat protein